MGDVIVMERRKEERTACSRPAFATIGELVIDGRVVDRSAGGMRFMPEVAYVDGRLCTDAQEIMEALLVGDQLVVSMAGEERACGIGNGRGRATITLQATIRWMGQGGIGLEGHRATLAIQRAA